MYNKNNLNNLNINNNNNDEKNINLEDAIYDKFINRKIDFESDKQIN